MDRNELRRLQKAARDNDKAKLLEWGKQLEDQIRQEFEREYQDEIKNTVNNLLIALAYTLHFSEETKFPVDSLPDFIEDLFVTFELFTSGEYNPSDYAEELKQAGLEIYDLIEDTKDKNTLYNTNKS